MIELLFVVAISGAYFVLLEKRKGSRKNEEVMNLQ